MSFSKSVGNLILRQILAFRIHIQRRGNYGDITVVLICLLFFPVLSHSAALSADDFITPALAPDPQKAQAAMAIQKPEAVKEDKGLGDTQAVSAANAQEAVNAAIKRIDVGGCQEIKFPSGFGWVSTGIAVYGVAANPTANLVAQRNAYQVAFLNAEKNLASALKGLSTKAREELNQQFNF